MDSAEQSVLRPIAVMMPTGQGRTKPSISISSADVLYESGEWRKISRQMAVISNWTGLSKIGNVRSCRGVLSAGGGKWGDFVRFGGCSF